MDKIVEMLGNLRGKVPAGMPEGGAPPMPRGGKVAVMAMGGAAAVAYTAYSSLFDGAPPRADDHPLPRARARHAQRARTIALPR